MMTSQELKQIITEMEERHLNKFQVAFKIRDNYAIIQDILNRRIIKNKTCESLWHAEKIKRLVNHKRKELKTTELIASEIVKREITLQNNAK